MLFDADPMQWGNPRPFQLAALVVLTRYASERHARQRWAILQDTSGQWNEGLVPQALYHWQKDRTDLPANAGHFEQWGKALARSVQPDQAPLPQTPLNTQSEKPLYETWVIGAPGLKPLQAQLSEHAQTAYCLECYVPLDLSHLNELCIQINQAKQEKIVYLPLPAQDVQTRILRNPFKVSDDVKSEDTKQTLQLSKVGISSAKYGNVIYARYPLECVRAYNIFSAPNSECL